MSHERPPSGPYYETRLDLMSQGDIFDDVLLAYPTVADEIVPDTDEPEETARRFISGPLAVGKAILITPTCSMRSQSSGKSYAHPVRTLVPVRPIDELVAMEIFDEARKGLAERRDALINYMYLPADARLGLEPSVALLYMPITLHHDMIEGSRVTQLTSDAASQLQKKLVWHVSSMLLDRSDFDPPMD